MIDLGKYTSDFIDENAIETLLSDSEKNVSATAVDDILAKAQTLKGLTISEVAMLLQVSDEATLQRLYKTAEMVKETIYGKRLVMFAPLYISNLCKNECTYCAFRVGNKALHRRVLRQDEINLETENLLDQGHKRILLVAGESYPKQGFQYVLDSIRTVYAAQTAKGNIRRINVNVAPLTLEEFAQLKAEKIGTYQIFQETYHRETYQKVHVSGMKSHYDWRVTAPHRAMETGIDDVGIGILFGLYDYKFEVLALMQHIAALEKDFGVGPHTLSVPRMEPASGSDISAEPPYPVSDNDFKKIVAILRIAVPYTGIIMSTRETAQMRRDTFALGVSQISAGSRTNPGGYTESEEDDSAQFSLGDHRPLDEVIRDVASMGYMPSFCTGCYRMGRTGHDFMDLAKPGEIKKHCDPNAVSSFTEYLMDFGSAQTKEMGFKLINETIDKMEGVAADRARKMHELVKGGKHDLFC